MKLQVKDVSVTFEQKKILENLNLSVAAGEFVALIGPSGCGKSTLLNILAGVLAPESISTWTNPPAVLWRNTSTCWILRNPRI